MSGSREKGNLFVKEGRHEDHNNHVVINPSGVVYKLRNSIRRSSVNGQNEVCQRLMMGS